MTRISDILWYDSMLQQTCRGIYLECRPSWHVRVQDRVPNHCAHDDLFLACIFDVRVRVCECSAKAFDMVGKGFMKLIHGLPFRTEKALASLT